jgi:flagellar basal-body rod protein FlgB
MFESLDLFRSSALLMRHAGERQALAAVNIANADTPGFRARSLPSFAEAAEGLGLRTTRQAHLGGGAAPQPRAFDSPGEASPNGNTVSIEAEMFASVQAAREHNQAIALWRHSLSVLRATLGRS